MERKLHHQSGMTLISFLLLFVIAGFLLLLGLKMAPAYLDHIKVKSSLEGLKSEAGLADKPVIEIKTMLRKRWDINSIEGIDVDEDVTFEKSDGSLKVEVAYNVEKHIIGNMSVLLKFDDSIMVGGSN